MKLRNISRVIYIYRNSRNSQGQVSRVSKTVLNVVDIVVRRFRPVVTTSVRKDGTEAKSNWSFQPIRALALFSHRSDLASQMG